MMVRSLGAVLLVALVAVPSGTAFTETYDYTSDDIKTWAPGRDPTGLEGSAPTFDLVIEWSTHLTVTGVDELGRAMGADVSPGIYACGIGTWVNACSEMACGYAEIFSDEAFNRVHIWLYEIDVDNDGTAEVCTATSGVLEIIGE